MNNLFLNVLYHHVQNNIILHTITAKYSLPLILALAAGQETLA